MDRIEKFFVTYLSGHCGASLCWDVEEVESWEEAIKKAKEYNENRLEVYKLTHEEVPYCEYCGMPEPLQWRRARAVMCTGGWAGCVYSDEPQFSNCEECQKYVQTC